jgi:hypothetical protein
MTVALFASHSFAVCVFVIVLATSSVFGSSREDGELGPIATDTVLILEGAYSKHLDHLKSIFQSDAVNLPPEERERCLAVIAALKKDVPKHIDVVTAVRENVGNYTKGELVAHAFGLHVILSQCAYSVALMEQAIIEAAPDSKWRLQFKRDKVAVHQSLMDQQQKCFGYAFGIL